MHGHGAVRYAMYAVTITKLELLRTNYVRNNWRAAAGVKLLAAFLCINCTLYTVHCTLLLQSRYLHLSLCLSRDT